jgi:hypothetical protein
MTRERKRQHDDVHFPLQGKGKRSHKSAASDAPPCPYCGLRTLRAHLCVADITAKEPT